MQKNVYMVMVVLLIEFGSPSGAASNLGLTIVTLADFSDDDYWDFFIIIMARISI